MIRKYVLALLRPKKFFSLVLIVLAIGFALAAHSQVTANDFSVSGRAIYYAGLILCLGASIVIRYLPD